MFIGSPPLKLSAITNEDSDGNAMLKAHAYLAQSHGEVNSHVEYTGGNQNISGFVGNTNDPAGAGTKINNDGIPGASAENIRGGVSFDVAKGEYFEITTGSASAATVLWRSFGPLKKPVDFN